MVKGKFESRSFGAQANGLLNMKKHLSSVPFRFTIKRHNIRLKLQIITPLSCSDS